MSKMMEHRIKADGVIFDVDGTLWDSTDIVKDAWNKAFIDSGYDDPHISEDTICGQMSVAYSNLGELEKALDLMKRHNGDSHFSDQIGCMLAVFMNRPEEAVPFLSQAIVNGMSNMLNAMLGYVFLYRSRNDWASALEISFH